jgi:hypothetical protein
MRSRYLLASLLGAGLALLSSLPSAAEPAPSKEKIDSLIEQMGNGSFAEREKASKALLAIGEPALEALRQAAKSEDAEVRKRAGDILPKIEKQVESRRALAPKRVHLVYKETPLDKAVADFQKKSGYTFHLHDPEGKLKERKVTLDSGETTFWHALGLFCAKAELREGSIQDLIQFPPPPGAAPLPAVPQPPQPPQAAPPAVQRRPVRLVAPRMPAGMPGWTVQIILKDGKAKKRPTDDASAIRVRVLGKSERFGEPGEGEVILALEVSPEPKVLWEELKAIRLDKVLDDRDQELKHIIPQVQQVRGFGGAGGVMLVGQVAAARPGFAMPGMMGGGVNQQVPLQLKKGAKEAKSLKELKGVLTAQMLGEAQPLIVADKLKADETFKGKEGGYIKIEKVKAEEERTTIDLEFQQPSPDKIVPALLNNGMQGFGFGGGGAMPPVRIIPARPIKQAPPAGLAAPPPPPLPAPAAAPPAPPVPVQAAPMQMQIVMNGGFGFAGGNGLSIQDEKGKALPMQITQTKLLREQKAGGFTQTLIYTLVCQHDKDKGKPSKIVFLGRKRATIDIPFAFKDVPLP